MFFSLRRLSERKAAQHRAGRQTKSKQRSMHPRLEALEDRRLLTTYVMYHGGAAGVPPVLANVQVQAIYYDCDPNVATNPQTGAALNATINAMGAAQGASAPGGNQGFFNTILPSQYIGALTEYSAQGVTIGPGSFTKAVVLDANDLALKGLPLPTNITTGNLKDSQIQTALQELIIDGTVDAPNDNTLYLVFLPPGISVTRDTFGETQPIVQNGIGYHFDSQTPAPVPGLTGQFFSYAVDTIKSSFDLAALTTVTSHEIAEAITDPSPLQLNAQGINTFPPGTAPPGWYYTPMLGAGEIGDLCESAPPINVQGYTVQQLWSNFIAHRMPRIAV